MFRTQGVQSQLSQLNPQILSALQLTLQVGRDIGSFLPEARRRGNVTVSESRVRSWQAGLQAAVRQLEQIPVILIFPPPPFVEFINGAIQQLNQALATLAGIPIVAQPIFPPQPGQAVISLRTLQFLLTDLGQAAFLMIQALQTA